MPTIRITAAALADFLAALALALASPAAAVDLSVLAVFGTESARLGHGALVEGGAVGSNHRVHLAPRARAAEDVWADLVRAGPRASIGGDVYTNQFRGRRAELGGDLVSPLALPVVAMLPPVDPAAPGHDAVRVPDGEARDLLPGAYSWVYVGRDAELSFTGGAYHVARLIAAPNATLHFAAPASVNAKWSVRLNHGVRLVGAEGVGAADVRFALGRGVFWAGPGAEVAAHVLAPGGRIHLGRGARARGAFFARRITVGSRARVTGEAPPLAIVGVPDLLALGAAEARATLDMLGLAVGDIAERPSAMIPSGDVVAQSPAAGTELPVGSGVDLTLSAADDPTALALPSEWTGVWNFEIALTRAGHTTPYQIDAFPNVALCPGDPLGAESVAAATSGLVACDATVDGTTASVACSGGFDDGACAVAGSLSLELTQSADAIGGSGAFAFDSGPGCPDPTAVFEDSVVVTATRVSNDPGACEPPASSLVQKLFEYPEWLLLEGGL